MDFDNPLYSNDGDASASFIPDTDDDHSSHPSPLHSPPHHSSPHHSHASHSPPLDSHESSSHPGSPKRRRQTTYDIPDEDDIMRNVDEAHFSRSEPMDSQPASSMKDICSELKALYHLDEEHDQVARKSSMCPPAERHANIMYAIAATHQHQASSHESVAYGETFKTFVRMKARMTFLIPTLQAYSNSPNKSGTLPKTLYYLCLDAVDKQPDDWREENLLPGQLKDEPSGSALKAYGTIMGVLLKYQRSHLRVLLLKNILETQRIHISGPVPNRTELVTLIYSDLPPDNQKWTEAQIKARIGSSWLMRIRMAYLRLVLVHYYTHPETKGSQWAAIDERLAILRKSSPEFESMHANLVLAKDKELFSSRKEFKAIPIENFTIPSVAEVEAALIRKQSTREALTDSAN